MIDGYTIEHEWGGGVTDSGCSISEQIRQLLIDALHLNSTAQFDAQTQLLGALPDLDSMAVVGLITTIEQQFGFLVDDDEISADVFETFGSLVQFVENHPKEK